MDPPCVYSTIIDIATLTLQDNTEIDAIIFYWPMLISRIWLNFTEPEPFGPAYIQTL